MISYTAKKGLNLFGSETGAWMAETTAGNVTGVGVSNDLSATGIDLDATGTMTKSAVTAGAELMQWSGFSAANYLSRAYGAELDIGTNDFTISGWFKVTNLAANKILFSRTDAPNTDELLIYALTSGAIRIHDTTSSLTITSTAGLIAVNTWYMLTLTRIGATMKLYINDLLAGSLASSTSLSFATGLRFGAYSNGTTGQELTAGSLSLWRIDNTTGRTSAQVKTIYTSEKTLFKANSIFTQVGNDYSLDLRLDTVDRSEMTDSMKSISLGGNQETTFNRTDVMYGINIKNLTKEQLPAYRSWLQSVSAGETFTFDPYGTIASEDAPLQVKATPGFKESRVGTLELFNISLKMREV